MEGHLAYTRKYMQREGEREKRNRGSTLTSVSIVEPWRPPGIFPAHSAIVVVNWQGEREKTQKKKIGQHSAHFVVRKMTSIMPVSNPRTMTREETKATAVFLSTLHPFPCTACMC